MAADRIKGITVEIGGDTTKLQSALHLIIQYAYLLFLHFSENLDFTCLFSLLLLKVRTQLVYTQTLTPLYHQDKVACQCAAHQD